MRGASLAAVVAVVLTGLPAAPAGARVDPVVPLDPFTTRPESCIVPAVVAPGAPCSPLGSRERGRVTACITPVLYLGSPPGPCPAQPPPPGRIVPVLPSAVSR